MIGRRRPQQPIPAWRALAALVAVVLALAAAAGRWQADAAPPIVSFSADIDGAQASVESDAVGSASVTLEEEMGLLSWTLTWSGFASEVTAIHFHGPASPGEDAFVTIELSNISGLMAPSAGSTTIDETQQAELLADLWYINIHSEDAPLGEIRGQVIREAEPAPTPTFPPCDDPDNDAGGELAFIGLGTPNHRATRQGDVCPGASETWSFATGQVSGVKQFIGIRVIEKSPAIAISILTPDLTSDSLAPGDEVRASHLDHPAEYEITVAGASDSLAGYRLQVCRSSNFPCVFSEDVTPDLPGDANCSGVVDSIDAALVLQLIADLIDTVTCSADADTNGNGTIDAIDATLILQLTAGLLG